MFLDVLRRRNRTSSGPPIAYTETGTIPANSYVSISMPSTENARLLRAEGDRLNLKVFAMTKRVSRNTGIARPSWRGGIDRAVAVDMACAIACHARGCGSAIWAIWCRCPRRGRRPRATLRPTTGPCFQMKRPTRPPPRHRRSGREQAILARVQTQGRYVLSRPRRRICRRSRG